MARDALRFLDQEDIRPHIQSMDPKVVLNKELSMRQYVSYMLSRTNKMFEWKNLPPTIPATTLELYLQVLGYAAFVEIDNIKAIEGPMEIPFQSGLYCFFGGVGGERDIYYRPRMFTLANPRLKGSLICPIIYSPDEEKLPNSCVLMRNDTNYTGLMPMFNRYAAQMVENDISIRSAQINARAQIGINASNDAEAETARKYLDDLEAGKLAVIGKSGFIDGITVANVGIQSANVIIQLIELQQYLKASWFNDLGLNANFNMKREYISREEIGSQTDVLLPLVDDMLECRLRACEIINKLFGTDISVEKNSAWADKDQTILNSLAAGAIEGNVPLVGDAADRLEVPNVSKLGNIEGNSPGAGEGGSEGEVEGESTTVETGVGEEKTAIRQAAAEAVSMIIEKLEGGDETESKTSEESKESDPE